jgi:hypothetical protein
MPTLKEDEETPYDRPVTPEPWSMHPELPKVGVPLVADNGNNQRRLELILSEVQATLKECRLIRKSGQDVAEKAIAMFDKLPALERRMNRVEYVAAGATVINIVMLFIASCGR